MQLTPSEHLETSWNILKDLESLLERPNLHNLALRLFEVIFAKHQTRLLFVEFELPFQL
jgi:hypothetical protein